MRWLSWLPEGVLRWLMGRQLGSLMPAKTAETALLHAMFQELLRHHLTKADILSSLWRTIDFCALKFAPQDLADWPGQVLLALADDDPGTPEATRAALKALYPEARLHLFYGTGHVTSVLKEAEYQAVIGEFLHGQLS